MSIVHKVTGYDRRTDKLELAFDLPCEQLDDVRKLVDLPPSYLECLGSFRLDPGAALQLASMLRVTIDVDRYEWFIEPFAEQSAEAAG